jgi:hypothetical protein
MMYVPSMILIPNKEYLCDFNAFKGIATKMNRFLRVRRFGYFPSPSANFSASLISKTRQKEKIVPNIDTDPYCHHGIAVSSGINETKVCLCPPNYFGTRCQWQNQRVSLTLQLLWQSTASTTVIFQVIIMLIDEDGQIAANHEQIIYMPSRDCDTKFNIYLLYPHRPKNSSSNYSIHIDLFEKKTLNYWGSWYLSIPFQFLPVNRIVSQLRIPEVREIESSCLLPCGEHGKCMRYMNKKSSVFCRCDQGYSGARCEIQHKCDCASDSFCLASSICVCPLY